MYPHAYQAFFLAKKEGLTEERIPCSTYALDTARMLRIAPDTAIRHGSRSPVGKGLTGNGVCGALPQQPRRTMPIFTNDPQRPGLPAVAKQPHKSRLRVGKKRSQQEF